MLSRRGLLSGFGAALALGSIGAACGPTGYASSLTDDAEPGDAAADERRADGPVDFLHGVASGDPMPDRVILWTRVTPRADEQGAVEVRYELSPTPTFASLASSGVVVTGADRDHTVKVDATGLAAGTTYYFRFRVGDAVSPTGRTRTAPAGAVDRLRFAVVSCASLAHGYFHVYRELAERADLDAVLCLGDYLYEYGNGVYGDVRNYDPPTEAVTLADYRRRHAHYKRDPDLRAVHQQHAFVAVWDDHEFANDAWAGGAKNHHPGAQGAWRSRQSAAMQAYFEWMPVREQPDGRIWRRLAFGGLVDLVMLDTRIWGRAPQAAGDVPALRNLRRSLLGDAQERWLVDAVTTSTARWKIIGQQVRVAPLRPRLNTDAWDGYPGARARLLEALATSGTDNVVVLTGDVHSSWAFDLPLDPYDAGAYDASTGRGSLAVEFVTPSVTSPSELEGAPASIDAQNPHLRYHDDSRRGYLVVDCQPERVQCEWFHLAPGSIEGRERSPSRFSAAWQTRDGENRLRPGDVPSAPRCDAPALAAFEPC